MAKRYELSHRQWERLKDSLPGKVTDRGRTAADNRWFVNGVLLWVLRSGARAAREQARRMLRKALQTEDPEAVRTASLPAGYSVAAER